MTRRHQITLLVFAALAACAPRLQPPGPPVEAPRLLGAVVMAADGARLPLRSWLPDRQPTSIILALHGFNDYSNAFEEPAQFWRTRGIATYAYDQRGFGSAPHPGRWAGTSALTDDLRTVTALVMGRHPETPLFLFGESMGGAVILAALAEAPVSGVRGVVLASPAVWGRQTMDIFKRIALWLSAHTVPWLKVSGRGLGITPSDNREMLKKLSQDPLVIKETRIDALWGVVNLMDAAYDGAPALSEPALILYGEKDEIIPKGPTRLMLEQLPPVPPAAWRVAIYPEGYHMLTRDLQAEVVLSDIAHWVAKVSETGDGPGAKSSLPSGADDRSIEVIAED